MSKRTELIQYLANIERKLSSIYGSTYRAVLEVADVRKSIEAGVNFTWEGNPAAEKKLTQLLNDLSSKAALLIGNGVQQGYKRGEEHGTQAVVERLGKGKAQKEAVREICQQATKERREQGMTAHAYATAERGGLTLSSRVWNLTGNAKKELEIIIQNGILEGKSANEIASSIKGYLNNPNALFRRVRNKKTGNFELSEAAKRYNPGQGVYRSAYKNALRLVRTEMTNAYRRAEWESYQNNPLVTSYEIRLSSNHTTTTTSGKVVRLVDICDKLAGVYPKTFRWEGWHPNCRCVMVPIVVTPKDFGEYLKARRKSRQLEWKPKTSRQVTDIPPQLTGWIEQNRRRMLAAPKKPSFIEDNKGGIQLAQQQEKKKLQLFSGTLQQFAAEILKTGRSIGKVSQVGRIDDAIKANMVAKGLTIETETIIVLDKTIIKYIDHPKAAKGAVVPAERYGLIEQAIKNPLHIYEDLNSKELVYVYTHPYEEGKLIKVVVQPNYKYKGATANVAKSWGVVEEGQMNHSYYRKIK